MGMSQAQRMAKLVDDSNEARTALLKRPSWREIPAQTFPVKHTDTRGEASTGWTKDAKTS
jgi:hypothetical protein